MQQNAIQNLTFDDWQGQLAALCAKTLRRLPSKRDEAWKFTALEPFLGRIPVRPAPLDITKTPAFSPMNAGDVTRLCAASEQGQYTTPYDLTALYSNTQSQRFIFDACAEIEPIMRHMQVAGTGIAMTHSMIQVLADTHPVLVETIDASTESWLNQSADIHVGAGASLLHIRHYTGSATSALTHAARVQVATRGRYTLLILADHGGLQRNEAQIDLIGEGAEGQVYALNLAAGTAQLDQTVLLRHLAPSCRSDQFVRSIVMDRAQSVFQGKIYVGQVAQQTDGYQLSNAILLSPTAVMQVKPELEIYADDVKCSHGSTTAPVDSDALFYLQSRGLPLAEARHLVLTAFCAEVLERIPDDAQRATAQERVTTWLSTHL